MTIGTVFIFAFVVYSPARASSPRIRTYQSQNDFARGTPKGVSITNSGEIILAPKMEQLFATQIPLLWSWAADSRGNIYVGGGNSGKVFKIDSQGNSTVVFEASELQIYALAVDRGNNVYVGTSPQGKVYKLPGGKEQPADRALFFDPKETYIWSLVVDPDNNIYVGTGDQGRIYKIDSKGNGAIFYDSEETHIRALALTGTGDLIAGTSDNGHVLKINPKGQAFVLYDSPLAEITGLIVDQKNQIYAAAVGMSRRPMVSPKEGEQVTATSDRGAEEDTDDDSVIVLPTQEISVTGPARLKKENSALYRIDESGMVKNLWESGKEHIYAIAFDNSGNVIIGTGDEGKLYTLNQNSEISLLAELDQVQITAIGRNNKDQVFLCTSNSGTVYRIEPEYGTSGEYLSEVIDAAVISQWGSISWVADAPQKTRIEFFSRSGNTEEPDQTWSPWSAAYLNSAGEPITSPTAQYVQFKAAFFSEAGSATPRLKEVDIAYLQRNTAPEIVQIDVREPGVFFPESQNQNNKNPLTNGSATDPGSSQNQFLTHTTYQKGYRSVSWQADDENGDYLLFDIYYRGEDENSWKTLVEDYPNLAYSWDSELLPDGRYLLKIVAKDNAANPPGLALSSEKMSQPFLVDNSGPLISNLTIKAVGSDLVVSFKVQDSWSIIKTVETGLNAEEWKLVYPVDGINDSKSETYEVKLDRPSTLSNTVVIKAKDFWENIGFGKQDFQAQ